MCRHLRCRRTLGDRNYPVQTWGISIAPPGQEGWPRHQEKYREASFDGADGVVVQDQTEMFLNLNHHPVCAASDASHFLLTGAATPPGQEGRWHGSPGMLLLFEHSPIASDFSCATPLPARRRGPAQGRSSR